MKKSKKLCLIFLMAAFTVLVLPAAGFLSGCGTENTEQTAQTAQTEQTEQTAQAAQAAQLPQHAQQQNEQEGAAVNVDYEAIAYEVMPDNVKALVDGHKKEAAVVIVAVNYSKYIFIALGPRPTGGYSVAIKSVTERQGVVTVVYGEQKPEKGAMVTQAFTYPWIVIKIDTELPVDTLFE
ncbi:MAG TPA: hypothetical protein DDZ65_10095 [Firmicutes bacterium]|jgi:flagellar basal body-associated protein FliL|nr:hypothetical protein [Bacillota bacterium]